VKKPPVDVDTDGDGIVDRLDKCPTEPEDKDGFEDEDGCPDPDNDKDGVPDVTDKCPLDPEDKDGFEDEDGCPDPDNDKDGFLDGVDKCPNEAEVFNGFQDDDGCPDKGAPLAVLTNDQIEIKQQVNFATDKSTIKKNSFKLLATVAVIMKLHPEITKVRVEGHTDNHGTAEHNMKLSQDRADSVRKHLIEVDGIDAARLESVGYGLTRPIADNKKAKGRAANRRSAFVILQRAPAPGATAPAGAAPPAPAAPAEPAPPNIPALPAPPAAPAPPTPPNATP
jgi:outer membrane protein OmpA-like peptidoglycan-associated protein